MYPFMKLIELIWKLFGSFVQSGTLILKFMILIIIWAKKNDFLKKFCEEKLNSNKIIACTHIYLWLTKLLHFG